MKTIIDSASQASVDKAISDIMMRRPRWVVGGRSPNELDCYGFVLEVYSKGFGIDLVDPHAEQPDSVSAVAAWFREQKRQWLKLDGPEPYCLVGLGRAKHLTHVGLYHPEDRVFHLTDHGVVGQIPSSLHAYGYSFVEYYQHRSLAR